MLDNLIFTVAMLALACFLFFIVEVSRGKWITAVTSFGFLGIFLATLGYLLNISGSFVIPELILSNILRFGDILAVIGLSVCVFIAIKSENR